MARTSDGRRGARVKQYSAKRPRFHQAVAKDHPGLIAAVDAVGKAVRDAGPLDEKTIELVQLGAAAAVRSEGAVHSHVRRALAAGASAEEIRHAVIALVSTIGFPHVMAALSWVGDELTGPRSGRRR